MCTPAQLHRRAALADVAAGVYRSDVCHIGTHSACEDGVQRPPEPEAGVRYEVCSCGCHAAPTVAAGTDQ